MTFSLNSFKSFDEFKSTLLEYHIMLPQTKSYKKLKMYCDMGYCLLFKDTQDVNLRIASFVITTLDGNCYIDLSELDWRIKHYKSAIEHLKIYNNFNLLLSNRYKIITPKDFEYISGANSEIIVSKNNNDDNLAIINGWNLKQHRFTWNYLYVIKF